MNICVYGASSNAINGNYIKETEHLGNLLAQRGHGLVYGAGANGLMGAVARGTAAYGGKIVGVAPTFFEVDGVLYDGCTEFIPTETMRERKQIMEDRSDAFIMVPGGIGTFEEFFEILTLKQLCRHNKPIAVFNIEAYYDKLIAFLEHSINQGFMKPICKNLYKIFDQPEAMLDYIEQYDDKPMQFKDLK